jgi:hypothetical protein
VVCGCPRLALATTGCGYNAHHVGAARFPAVAPIIVGHGCDLLKMFLAPLLAILSALVGIPDGDAGQHFSNTTWGCPPTTLLLSAR